MKLTFKKMAAVGLLALGSVSANAGIISGGNHYTDAGTNVNLSGLEWLTWDETFNVSRTAIETGHGNFINNGWRYATGIEFGALLSSISPQHGYGTLNHDATRWLWENFDAPNYATINGGFTPSRLGNLFFGADDECNVNVDLSCVGFMRLYGDKGSFDGVYFI